MRTCPGWRRSFDPEFRQWILDFGRDQLPRVYQLLEQYRPGREVHIFRSREQAACYLAALDAARQAAGPVQLRPYREGDCPALAALFTDTVHTVNAADYTPAQLDAWAPAAGPDLQDWDKRFKDHITLVAEVEGRLAGFGIWTLPPATWTGSMWAAGSSGRGWPPPSATRWKRLPPGRWSPMPRSRPAPSSPGAATGSCGPSRWSAEG